MLVRHWILNRTQCQRPIVSRHAIIGSGNLQIITENVHLMGVLKSRNTAIHKSPWLDSGYRTPLLDLRPRRGRRQRTTRLAPNARPTKSKTATCVFRFPFQDQLSRTRQALLLAPGANRFLRITANATGAAFLAAATGAGLHRTDAVDRPFARHPVSEEVLTWRERS